jgi:hypothetical protein
MFVCYLKKKTNIVHVSNIFYKIFIDLYYLFQIIYFKVVALTRSK